MSPQHFAHTLLDWFSTNGRDLPWRHTSDPYAIWLSEVILQQTRISQGTDYWKRFMAAYPTVDDLAAASEDEVLKLWQGLGYYSRARNLHKAARQIVALGKFPDTLEGLKKLKGVGDYTAAAIASFAFGIPAAAVDGNYHRVLSRVWGIDTPINSTQGKKEFQALADGLITEGLGHNSCSADFNAAMMDFGATQCTPKSPACIVCPFNENCEALRQGKVDELPVKLKTVKVKTRRFTYFYIRHHGQIAIRQRGEGDIWQGLWEPVVFENQKPPAWDGKLTMIASRVKHVLTHRIIMADFYLVEANSKPQLPPDYIWIDESLFDNYAVPRLVEILMERLSRIHTRSKSRP